MTTDLQVLPVVILISRVPHTEYAVALPTRFDPPHLDLHMVQGLLESDQDGSYPNAGACTRWVHV